MAKRALLVGINQYANPKFNLRGCLYDMESLARLLTGPYDFQGDGLEFLRDTDATRVNILARLEAMLSGAQSGDTLVFAYSGHGTQARSNDAGEPDLKDECMVPHESTYSSLIRDNDLYALFNRYIDEHIKFTAIYDMCHSGSIFRDVTFDENSGMIVEDVVNRCLQIHDLETLSIRSSEIGPYNVLSACRDEETAADLRAVGPERLPRGAFSYALHNLLAASRDAPVAIADPQIAGGIAAVSNHRQTPNYMVIDVSSPLIRY